MMFDVSNSFNMLLQKLYKAGKQVANKIEIYTQQEEKVELAGEHGFYGDTLSYCIPQHL